MRTPTVIIPWRAAPGRWLNYAAVMDFWTTEFPDWPVVSSPGPKEGPFNLAAARNMGVAYAAMAPVVLVNDADTVPTTEGVLAAVELATEHPDEVVIGYSEYRSCVKVGGVYTTVPIAISGLYVCTPAAWWRTHGQDERFKGWAPEDYAWLHVYRAVHGKDPLRAPGHVWALDHEHRIRDGALYEQMVERYRLYQAAAGDKERLLELARGAA